MLCKCWLLTLEPLFFLPEITCQEANQCVKQVSELCFQPWALAPHVPWPAWETTQLGPHRVSICPTHWETALHWHVCRPIQRQFPISCQGLSFRFYFLKEEWKSGDYIYIYIYIYILFVFMKRYTILLPGSTRMQCHIIHLEVENIQKFYSYKIQMLVEFTQLDINNQWNYHDQPIVKHPVP